jgi:CheY-like chemotaxis protein
MRTLEVLLVEDNYPDVRWTQVVLETVGLPHRLTVLGDGADAWLYLQKHGTYTSAPTPDLVLLDLNLPKMGGDEIYQLMKDHPLLALIPVCLVTNSELEREYLVSLGLDAKCYIIKPLRYTSLKDSLACFDSLRPYAAALEPPAESAFA